MAFSFGAAAPAATPFTGGLFGAPAASSASAFGASTAPAFGASSAAAFGTSTAPAFGAPSATTTTPAFGAAPAAASPFGAPAPAAASPFGGTGTTFGSTNIFGQAAPAPAVSNALVPSGGLFGAQPQQQPAAQARPGLNYKTKFEELPPQMQQELQKMQQEISSYRDECKALDNDSRLHDNVSIKQSLDSETAALRQTMQSLYQAVLGEEEGLLAFRERVMVLLRSTEMAIRLYQRSKLWREMSQAAGSQAAQQQQQQLLSSQALQEQISQPAVLPNPYVGLAVRGFGDAMEQYHKCISELERVMPAAAMYGGAGGGADEAAAVCSLPTLVAHMHDYFVHVAARLERLHGEVTRSREACLAQLRARGDYSDPFADARVLHHLPPASSSAGGRLGPMGRLPAADFYSFGGPAVSGSSGNPGGAGGGALLALGASSGVTGGGGGGAAGGSSVPASPAPAASGLGAAAATSGTPAPAGGGLFGLSPAPFGGAASPFGNPAGAGGTSLFGNPGGAFGTPLGGAAAAQQQQQRAGAARAGSSSSKKR
ncbi:hypothetical protein Agub_g15868 [Astrephomene gubernaculifera]|uniref:Nucleoporin p58/p45 n=1 Tax=Astrephomene gubernaculifera TaxID=47775 RepID=A0AAD3HU17_9CHLO|nr:hypothetical protein Agub_g15868 [Astrephomene gubernaculifera]